MDRLFGIAAACALLFSLTACSVKEDRSVCPSILTLRVADDDLTRSFDSLTVSILSPTGRVEEFRASVEDLVRGVEVEVPRLQPLHVFVSSDTGDMTVDYDALACLPGEESAKLVDGMVELFLQADDEYCEAFVELRRDYMNLTIIIQGMQGSILTVSADCGSLSIPSGTPSQPRFRAECRNISQDTYTLRVPRQSPGSEILLTVEGVDLKGERFNYGYFSVSDILREHGYDWTERILRDAIISLNGDLLVVGVVVTRWDAQDIDTVLQ